MEKKYAGRIKCFIDQYDQFIVEDTGERVSWKLLYTYVQYNVQFPPLIPQLFIFCQFFKHISHSPLSFLSPDKKSYLLIRPVVFQVNGTHTLAENISDNEGIRTAYRAYKAWTREHGPEERLPGLDYTPEQLFWISAANSWCSKYTFLYMIETLSKDVHAPDKIRILGAFANQEDFATDFKCAANLTMNPLKKCSLWWSDDYWKFRTVLTKIALDLILIEIFIRDVEQITQIFQHRYRLHSYEKLLLSRLLNILEGGAWTAVSRSRVIVPIFSTSGLLQ